METGFTAFWQEMKEIFFPADCLACGRRLDSNRRLQEDILFCLVCAADIWLLEGPLCRLCGKPFPGTGGDHLCSICLQQPWHFSKARAVAVYQGPLISVIQNFKYRGQQAGLSSFVRLKERLAHLASMAEPDLIAPVPLHKRNLRQRGFNQALLLARAFFPDQRHKITTGLLERSRWTHSQAGLSGQLRRRNIKGAFRVQDPEKVAGRTVLLVDDVFTTGATVNECARVLRGAGAIDVQVLTFCRVER